MRDWLDGIHPDDEAEYQRNVARVDRFIADLRQYMELQGLEHSGMRAATVGVPRPAGSAANVVGNSARRHDAPIPSLLPRTVS